jgi:hypothetical protein
MSVHDYLLGKVQLGPLSFRRWAKVNFRAWTLIEASVHNCGLWNLGLVRLQAAQRTE